MKTSEQNNEISPAMAAMQGEITPAPKQANNPHFGNDYADLPAIVGAIRGPCATHALFVCQEVTTDDHGVQVTTRITHKSGQWMEFGPLLIPLQRRDAQGIGSAITYGRRYALAAALSVVADDDDDGEEAVRPNGHSVEAPVSARAPGDHPASVSSSRASVPNAGGSGALTIRKVEPPWEGVPASIKAFLVLSDGRELPMYTDDLKRRCEDIAKDDPATPVEIIEKVSAKGKPYLNSIMRANEIPF